MSENKNVSRSRLKAYGMKFKTVEGLCTDCRILLARFEQHNTLRFANFCEVWRQMNFSVIYYAKPDSKGRRQMVEYLLRIFCGYISVSCPLQYRVGALYGLYAVYNTQIHQPKSKIRVTTTLWKEIQELHHEIIQQKHYDVDYIMRKLKDARAFHFVAMPIQLACGSREAIPDDERELGGVKSQSGNVQNLDDAYEMILKLRNMDEEYVKLKASLQNCSQINSLQDQRSLHVVSSDFIPSIESEIQDFEEWKSNYQADMGSSSSVTKPVGVSTLGLIRPLLTASHSARLAKEEEDLSTELSISGKRAVESRAVLIQKIKKNAFSSTGKGKTRQNQLIAGDDIPDSTKSTNKPPNKSSPNKYKRKQRLTRRKALLMKKKLKEST